MRGRRLEEWVGVVLAPTGEPGWIVQQEGYEPAREQEVESRFVVSNGFLGVRGSRAASRGPVWVSWLRSLSWAAWPRASTRCSARSRSRRVRSGNWSRTPHTSCGRR